MDQGIRIDGGSFRDPDGFVFRSEAGLYRQIQHSYAQEYRQLLDSGLYNSLTKRQLLITHQETQQSPVGENGWLIIQPEEIPFISYPYEWSFNQLKDAALLTLQVQQEALAHDMTLKDATAYNVQFLQGQPIFIDTLSFASYQEGQPWAPYKQFCEHFLGPLALMAHKDMRLHRLLLSQIDGIPVDLVSQLLPWHTYFRVGLLLHVHLHARAQHRYSSQPGAPKATGKSISKNSLLQLLQSLESTIRSLSWKPNQTLWADYYAHTNYQDAAMAQKEQEVLRMLKKVQPVTLWDIGANTGRFSNLALETGALVIALDFDPGATDLHYQKMKGKGQPILPLVLDVSQPSPALGWGNKERAALLQRPKPDTVLALALVHHLAISKNVPLPLLSSFFAELCTHLIIEFVAKEDSQVQRLLSTRQDVFPHYIQDKFEEAFTADFTIQERILLPGDTRTLYLLRRK